MLSNHSPLLRQAVVAIIAGMLLFTGALGLKLAYDKVDAAHVSGKWMLTRSVHGQVYVDDYNLSLADCWALSGRHDRACTLQH